MKRTKIRTADVRPEPQARFYIHTPTKTTISRTVRNVQNPWHEGIPEAKRAGYDASRAKCLYAASHSTERYADVCTDYRMRERIRQERLEIDKAKVMYRRWGLIA